MEILVFRIFRFKILVNVKHQKSFNSSANDYRYGKTQQFWVQAAGLWIRIHFMRIRIKQFF